MEKKVCVTGGAGYLASFLIKHLLEMGCLVHATLRTLGDASKVGLLKGLPHSDTRLKLFEADIYNPAQFSAAIQGCHVVLHMATPLQHYTTSKYKDTSEAAVAGVRVIMEACLNSNTVKKLVYTASVVAASPLKDDGSGYKHQIDEACWTPLNISYYHQIDEACWTPLNISYYQLHSDYVHSKSLAEKEVLSYNGKGIEVVSLVCGLVGGDTIQSWVPGSMAPLISQATNDGGGYKTLRFLEDLLAKVPIAHIQDVTRAHIFAALDDTATDGGGRFLCASAFLSSAHIASLIRKSGLTTTSIPHEFIEDVKRETGWGSTELEKLGFEYKYDAEQIICDSLSCAKRLGVII